MPGPARQLKGAVHTAPIPDPVMLRVFAFNEASRSKLRGILSGIAPKPYLPPLSRTTARPPRHSSLRQAAEYPGEDEWSVCPRLEYSRNELIAALAAESAQGDKEHSVALLRSVSGAILTRRPLNAACRMHP